MKTLILKSIIYSLMIVYNNLGYAQSYFSNGYYTSSGEKVALAFEEMYNRNKFTKYRNDKEKQIFNKKAKIYSLTVFKEGLKKKVICFSVKFNSRSDKFYRLNSIVDLKNKYILSDTKASRLNFNVVFVFHLFQNK